MLGSIIYMDFVRSKYPDKSKNWLKKSPQPPAEVSKLKIAKWSEAKADGTALVFLKQCLLVTTCRKRPATQNLSFEEFLPIDRTLLVQPHRPNRRSSSLSDQPSSWPGAVLIHRGTGLGNEATWPWFHTPTRTIGGDYFARKCRFWVRRWWTEKLSGFTNKYGSWIVMLRTEAKYNIGFCFFSILE